MTTPTPALPHKGDYVVVDRPGFTGWIIRLFTRSAYSHAVLMIDSNGEMVQAEADGARVGHLQHDYGTEPLLYSTTPLTPAQRKIIADAARKCVGVPYGFLDLAYLGLACLGVKWGWLLDRVMREDRMICSQLVAWCGQQAGVTEWLCGKPSAQLVTPGDLAGIIGASAPSAR